eukprot:scaffold2979_cov111-Isochrysis_galbana.AAC.1
MRETFVPPRERASPPLDARTARSLPSAEAGDDEVNGALNERQRLAGPSGGKDDERKPESAGCANGSSPEPRGSAGGGPTRADDVACSEVRGCRTDCSTGGSSTPWRPVGTLSEMACVGIRRGAQPPAEGVGAAPTDRSSVTASEASDD